MDWEAFWRDMATGVHVGEQTGKGGWPAIAAKETLQALQPKVAQHAVALKNRPIPPEPAHVEAQPPGFVTISLVVWQGSLMARHCWSAGHHWQLLLLVVHEVQSLFKAQGPQLVTLVLAVPPKPAHVAGS
jgi:hypothetical protein